MVAPTNALAAIPDAFGAAEAAPLLCAGVTTFNALRHSGAMPGDLVAILGSRPRPSRGALRQQARLPPVAIAAAPTRRRSPASSTRPLHRQCYRGHSGCTQPYRRRASVLANVTAANATSLIYGLEMHDHLVVVGVDGKSIQVSPFQLIGAAIFHLTCLTQSLDFSMVIGDRPCGPPLRARRFREIGVSFHH